MRTDQENEISKIELERDALILRAMRKKCAFDGEASLYTNALEQSPVMKHYYWDK